VFSPENSSSIESLVKANMCFRAPLPNLDEHHKQHDIKYGLRPDS
jgi:hypothetical protein